MSENGNVTLVAPKCSTSSARPGEGTRTFLPARSLKPENSPLQNKTEAGYEQTIKDAITLGDVAWYRFEGLKLRLADNTFYTPDFAVMLSNGQIECHEVKGFWTDDARVKV